ncbi:carbohydrate binding domain-containing protein [Agarivorans sp. MS3-6]|uniref:carbohydrate binding domain-containing protein n=1 Tax=Agarivorans sp. TSD2052 TaxID=2937286 RepID=UPI00200C7B2A|nr:carbohydrate binding domain-containing protein [Agarivorans sp. TSD2052]UPW19523.1 carbohydrate binding domain-containing protein [Agarivorans sp. TSD2052]
MLKVFLAIICGISISAVSYSAQAKSVKVINPDFEQGWYGWRHSGESAISDKGRDDESSAKITDINGRIEQDITVQPNTDYTLTLFMKGSGKVGVTTVGKIGENEKVVNKFQTLKLLTYTEDDYHPEWESISVDFNSGESDKVTIFAIHRKGGVGRFDRFRIKPMNK